MRRALFSLVAAFGLVAACAPVPQPPAVAEPPAAAKPQQVQLRQWSFAALSGWADDRHGEALGAFQKSCASILKRPQNRALADNPAAPGGRVGDWQGVCATALGMSTIACFNI